MFSIFYTTNRIAVSLRCGGTVHVGVRAEEVTNVNVVTTTLGSAPVIGTSIDTLITAGAGTVVDVVVASRKRTEACGIVVAGSVAYGTGGCIAAPECSGCQCLGNLCVVATAHILALAAYIIGKLSPFRIARYVPPCGADALHSAGVGTAGG